MMRLPSLASSPLAGASVAFTLLLAGSGARFQDLQVYVLVPGASQVYVVTHRGGLLSFLGHEHAIVPGDWSAELCLADPIPGGARGSLTIRTSSLVIDSDSARALAGMGNGPGPDDRRKIQEKMLDSLHLDGDRFPEVRLDLTAVTAEDGGRVSVEGSLTLHGVSRDVSFPMEVEHGEGTVRLEGTLRIRQRDFGIEPESIAAVVKVSNDVDLHFSLVAAPTSEGCEAGETRIVAEPRGMEYDGSMKGKTSITLSQDVLDELERTAGDESRSAVIERILRDHFRRQARARLHARDRERLDQEAEGLNQEADEVMDFQSWPDD